VRHVARMGEMRISYNILVGKVERKGPLGRPRSNQVGVLVPYQNATWRHNPEDLNLVYHRRESFKTQTKE